MAEDCELEESSNIVVDCDILEAAKENIQPLAGGRRVTALASVLATPHGLRDSRLEATRSRMRERVREAQCRVDRLKALQQSKDNGVELEQNREDNDEDGANGEDEQLTLEEAEEMLLDAYVRLVTWIVEHYPRGQSAASGILEQLEEATRVLRHSDSAKADARYLGLWVRYSGYVDHPEIIYQFLLANEIGTKWAKLYEEYANVLEKMKRRPKADEIYLLGISRKAEPLDHLERRHRDFQKRMMVSAPILDSETAVSEAQVAPAPSGSEPGRRVLGESTSTSTTSSIATPLTSTSSILGVFSARSSSSSLASLGPQGKSVSNGRIPVFIDPTGEAESASGNAWPELGTRAERIKENKRAPEKMQGAVLKQRGIAKVATKEAGIRARGAPKIVPFKDPELSTAASSSQTKLVPYRDQPQPPPTAASILRNGSRIVPFKDPESSSDIGPATKIVPFKDPEVPATSSSSSTASKIIPFKDPEPGPRRSSRLSKKPVNEESEPNPSIPEEDVLMKTTGAPGATARFVPFRDEEVIQGSSATSTVPETVMRLKALGEATKATSEAEALRKDPFKNYTDL